MLARTLVVNPNKYLPNIYLLKVNNRNTRASYETCSKLTIKTAERDQWRRLGVFFVNFEISHLVLVILSLTLSNCWVGRSLTFNTTDNRTKFLNVPRLSLRRI